MNMDDWKYSILINNKYNYKMIRQKEFKRIPLSNINNNINRPKNAIIFFDQPIKSRQRCHNLRQSMHSDYQMAMKRCSLGVKSSSLFNVSIFQKTRYKAIKSINKIKKITPALEESRLFELNDLVNLQNREEGSKIHQKTSKRIRIRVMTQNNVQKQIVIPKCYPRVSVKGFKII